MESLIDVAMIKGQNGRKGCSLLRPASCRAAGEARAAGEEGGPGGKASVYRVCFRNSQTAHQHIYNHEILHGISSAPAAVAHSSEVISDQPYRRILHPVSLSSLADAR